MNTIETVLLSSLKVYSKAYTLAIKIATDMQSP